MPRLSVSTQDEMHYLQGLCQVSRHKPIDYQTAENLARLKVSVDRTITEKDMTKNPDKGIL